MICISTSITTGNSVHHINCVCLLQASLTIEYPFIVSCLKASHCTNTYNIYNMYMIHRTHLDVDASYSGCFY